MTIWVVATMAFLALPLFIILLMSFSSGQFLTFPPVDLSLLWYEKVLTSQRWQAAAVNSLVIAFLAVGISLPAGVGLAISVYRLPAKWRSAIKSITLGPMIVPLIVFAIALFFVLARLGAVGTRLGVAIGHALLVMPFIFISVTTALEYFDDQLIEAAESLGASRAFAWRTILFPFVLPAVLVGTALAFVSSFDEVVIAIFVGQGGTLTIPSLMWRSLNLELTPGVAAVATIVTTTGIVIQGTALFWLWRRFQKSR